MTEEFLLNTGSTIEEGRLAKGGCKLTEDYMMECARCQMNPEDFRRLGCPQKVKVTSRRGLHSVVVYASSSDALKVGHVFMPRAIWSNVVVDPETFSTGSPLYKGSQVRIEPTDDRVLNACDLVDKLYRRGN
ncbi:MAG: molybdopterin dinucleotide binding domain-containing protein [Methanothrix sp.]|nr:molybdopterin dinucleotide binding domain-containing protein [Methanothrix sp.]